MAKLGRPKQEKRPNGWKEMATKVLKGDISEVNAAKELGISRQWLRIMMKRDYPNETSKDRRSITTVRTGKNNRKFTTYLESHFSDLDLCNMLIMHGECSRKCPFYKACEGEHKYQGLVSAMLKKIPLKDAQNTLETT